MKCLLLHCSRFAYTKERQVARTTAAEAAEVGTSDDFKNALAVFLAVEKGDDAITATKAAAEIAKIMDTAKAETVVINPFAHLSSTLAPLSVAKEISAIVADELKKLLWTGEVVYSSFGWYKSYEMSILAHDKSQLFREF